MIELTRTTPVAVVGAGRSGASLAVAMARAGYHVAGVTRNTPGAARSVADRVALAGGANRGEDPAAWTDPRDAGRVAGVVFVATPDRAIEAAVGRLEPRPGAVVVHLSGATPVSATALFTC